MPFWQQYTPLILTVSVQLSLSIFTLHGTFDLLKEVPHSSLTSFSSKASCIVTLYCHALLAFKIFPIVVRGYSFGIVSSSPFLPNPDTSHYQMFHYLTLILPKWNLSCGSIHSEFSLSWATRWWISTDWSVVPVLRRGEREWLEPEGRERLEVGSLELDEADLARKIGLLLFPVSKMFDVTLASLFTNFFILPVFDRQVLDEQ